MTVYLYFGSEQLRVCSKVRISLKVAMEQENNIHLRLG